MAEMRVKTGEAAPTSTLQTTILQAEYAAGGGKAAAEGGTGATVDKHVGFANSPGAK